MTPNWQQCQGGAADTLKGRTAIQRERQEEWAIRKPVKFSKDQCQVLHLRRRNPLQGNPDTGCSSMEKVGLRIIESFGLEGTPRGHLVQPQTIW